MQRERAQVLSGLVQLGPDLYYGQVYWLDGSQEKGAAFKSEVKDPPSSGWGTCFLIDRAEDDRGKPMRQVTLFSLTWFDSWQVSRSSSEYQSMLHPEHFRLQRKEQFDVLEVETRMRGRLSRRIREVWREVEGYGWSKDFDAAARVMRLMGEEVPLMQARGGGEAKVSGGKEVAMALLKPVKRTSRKGQVLEFFWPETKSIREAMAEMGISRSNVLSQLYLLQKDHGIGYELKGDAAIISMPDGVDNPWTEEEKKETA